MQLAKETINTTGCLLDYPCYKGHYKIIVIDLSKQQECGTNSKAIQQINFTGNLDQDGITIIYFIIAEGKKTISVFWRGTVGVL